jgi:hypothetical protein
MASGSAQTRMRRAEAETARARPEWRIQMLTKRTVLSILRPVCAIALGAMALGAMATLVPAHAQGQQLPNLSGTYKCEPEPSPCRNGQTFTVTQAGSKLDLKDESGNIAQGTVTSNISVSVGPTWNMLGTILPDNRVIQWSNGTQWRKQ